MAKYVDIEAYYENIIMQAYYNDADELRFYKIEPENGYVLHTKNHDVPVFDDEGMPTDEMVLGYTRGYVQVGYNYNFEANPDNIYAVLESEVPADQIFGGANNDHVTA